MSENSRREVGARKINLFQKLAQKLVQWKLTPNQISVASAVFATAAGGALYSVTCPDSNPIVLLIVAILGIQMRLVCNLIDGLMAIEGGLKTASGEIFNDFPDRISDIVIFIGAGFVAGLYNPLFFYFGWGAALAAVMTAYVRCLGAAMTGVHDFAGPFAKQHRMFLTTLGCLGTIFEHSYARPLGISMAIFLITITIGSVFTVLRRLRRLYVKLEGSR
jgi:phosphatidylglycerophosphate synthase